MSERANDDFAKVPFVPFEEYKERFKEFFTMKRENGIIEVRMHRNGDTPYWSYGHHNGWGKVLKAVGQDPENEVLILGSSGEKWLDGIDMEYAQYMMKVAQGDHEEHLRSTYDHQYLDGSDLLFPLLYDIHIPTIGVINGASPVHTEFPLVCDITLCAPDATFGEPHFSALNTPTGDGLYLVFQEVFGYKQANLMTLLGKSVTAQEALDMGIVADVVPREELYDRAWEIGTQLMTKDRYVRRMQHEIMIQRWRRVINADFNAHFMAEEWGIAMRSPNTSKALTKELKETAKGE